MKDLLLNDSGDLFLNELGDIQFTDSVKQAIEIRLKWFAKEWKLGPDLGIPYYDDVFVKNPSEQLIEERMREAISDVEEVDEILSFTLAVDRILRKLKVVYAVSSKENTIEGSLTVNV